MKHLTMLAAALVALTLAMPARADPGHGQNLHECRDTGEVGCPIFELGPARMHDD